MEKIDELIQKLTDFERIIHLPGDRDVTITGVTLAIVAAALLAVIVLIVIIVLVRGRDSDEDEYSQGDTMEMRESAYPDYAQPDPQFYPAYQQPAYPEYQQPAQNYPDYPQPGAPAYQQPAQDTVPLSPRAAEAAADVQQEIVPVEQVEIAPTKPFGADAAQQPRHAESASAEAMTVTLIGMGGYFDRKKIVQQDQIIIGRHPQRCTLVYPENEPGISAVHCRVQKKADGVYLTDLGSSHGTFVNGEKLNPNASFRLQQGDTFWLADHKNAFFMA